MSDSLKHLSSEFLANRHSLMAYIYGLVRNGDVAENIFQEVWLRLAEGIDDGVEIQQVSHWCRGVAKNLILRHWRDQRNAKVVMDSRLVDLVEQAFEESDSTREYWTIRREALNNCMEQLPEKSKYMMELKYERGHSFESMARILEKSTSSVMMAVSRIRQILAQCADKKITFSENIL